LKTEKNRIICLERTAIYPVVPFQGSTLAFKYETISVDWVEFREEELPVLVGKPQFIDDADSDGYIETFEENGWGFKSNII
tara:strand:- start:205 stop:447 length:243 start_codon:yes stop_codon:yes gene_type:complete